MEPLFFIVPIGVVLSVSVFLFFERKAINAKKQKEAQGLPPPSVSDIHEKFQRYDTVSNTMNFFLASAAISFVLATVNHNPSYGLIHALAYIFATTLIGSLIIFFLKMKFSILVKVFAAFLYGATHIVAASAAFLLRYIISVIS